MSRKIKIYILAIFNTVCLLIAAIDAKNLILWVVFAIVLMLNVWVMLDTKKRNM